jgi:hypothetical protein
MASEVSDAESESHDYCVPLLSPDASSVGVGSPMNESKCREVLSEVQQAIRADYHNQFTAHQLHETAITRLIDLTDRSLELPPSARHGDEQALEQAFHTELDRLYLSLRLDKLFAHYNTDPRWVCAQYARPWTQFWVFKDVFLAMEALAGYIRAHQHVAKVHCVNFNHSRRAEVTHVMNTCIQQAHRHIRKIEELYPEIVAIAKVILAARAVLLGKKRTLQELLASGQISTRDFEALTAHVDATLYRLQHSRRSRRLAYLAALAAR